MTKKLEASMEIRPETPLDVNEIEQVLYAAFKNHPYHEPGAEPTEHQMVTRLRQADALKVALVAEQEGVVLGFVALSPVTVDGEARGWLGLAPVAVHPKCQGMGIGQALVKAALAQARDLGAAGVVLLGEPGYYGRFGFEARDGLQFPGPPAEFFLSLVLNGPDTRGVVAYHPAIS